MTEGTVKFYNRMKRFGFITGDDKKDYFVHQSGLQEGVQLNEGDRVNFEVVEGDRGPKADKVTKL
jgi:cold shock protein